MPTTIPTVKVVRTECQGFIVTCSACRFHTMRATRYEADALAHNHRASHGRPDPADLED